MIENANRKNTTAKKKFISNELGTIEFVINKKTKAKTLKISEI